MQLGNLPSSVLCNLSCGAAAMSVGHNRCCVFRGWCYVSYSLYRVPRLLDMIRLFSYKDHRLSVVPTEALVVTFSRVQTAISARTGACSHSVRELSAFRSAKLRRLNSVGVVLHSDQPWSLMRDVVIRPSAAMLSSDPVQSVDPPPLPRPRAREL